MKPIPVLPVTAPLIGLMFDCHFTCVALCGLRKLNVNRWCRPHDVPADRRRIGARGRRRDVAGIEMGTIHMPANRPPRRGPPSRTAIDPYDALT